MQNNKKELIEFNHSLIILANKISKIYPEINNNTKGYLAFVLAKATKSHKAILLLCDSGLGEDATIISRSLFELMVQTNYILKDITNRRLERYFDYDWLIREKMLNKIGDNEEILKINGDGEEEIRKTVALIRSEALSKKKKHKYTISNSWSDKHLNEMSKEVGFAELYEKVYYLQCQITHSSIRTMNDYIKLSSDKLIIDAGSSDNFVNETLISTFNYFFYILKTINKYLGLKLDTEFLSLEEVFVMKFQNLKTKGL